MYLGKLISRYKEKSLEEVVTSDIKALMTAMLSQARKDLFNYKKFKGGEQRVIYLSASNWVNSDNFDHVTSFRNVCDVLGLNYDYIRKEMYNFEKKPTSNKKVEPSGLRIK